MVFKTPADIVADAELAGLRRALIVTALKPEMQAVRAHVTHLASSTGRSGTVYECGRFTAEGGDWLVIVAECGPGNHPAHSVVTNASVDFGGFELILFSGIAGSRKSDAPIGSVIAASQVYNPYSGKYANGDFSSRPHTLSIDFRLVQLARKVSRDEAWHGRIQPMLNGSELPPPHDCPQPFPPQSFVAPIVAVEAVVGDSESELARMINEHGSDAHAIEMEGYGAVFASEMERTPVIVVRGISDMLSGKISQADALLQPLAAVFAAAFTFELLNLWSQSQPRPSEALRLDSQSQADFPHPGSPSTSATDGMPPSTDAHGMTLIGTIVVLNFKGDASEFPADRVEAIAATVADEVGGLVTVVKSESGSYRLFLGLEKSSQLPPVDVLRVKLAQEHAVELLGMADLVEYRDICALGEEITNCSRALLSWPTELPDGTHLARPEVDQLWSTVGEQDHSATVILAGPGSGKSALLATFGAMALRNGWPTLALKADLLPPDIGSEEDLQRHLGLSLSPGLLIQRIASFRPVLLIIDQLDALASYLDLRTGRLNVLLNIVRRLGRTHNVHIVLSARTFEFEHDVRLRTILAESINLQLPPWAEIVSVLEAHGINAEGWPRDAQEVMRSPQALATYLRLAEHAGNQPFTTYQAMLDRLWTERILSLPRGVQAAQLANDIAQAMAEEENLWLAKVRFEDRLQDLDALLAQKILTTSEMGTSVGFAHQTLFDHALARSFATERGRLSRYVLKRQDSLFIRPKLWAGLTYLRAVERAAYEKELETLSSADDLRHHLKMLLIDFLGQQESPTGREELVMAGALEQQMYRPLVFRAISGSPGWFHRFKGTFLTSAMAGDPQSVNMVASVLDSASFFARDEVAALIRAHWSPDVARDAVSWRVLTGFTNWSEEVLDLVASIIDRSEVSPRAVDYVVATLGVEQPDMALKLVRAKLERDLAAAWRNSAERRNMPVPDDERGRIEWHFRHSPSQPFTDLVQHSNDWDSLGALAEKEPEMTLEQLWPWFLKLLQELLSLEESEEGALGYAVSHSLDYRFEGEGNLDLPEPPILGAFRIAAEGIAANDAVAFETWVNSAVTCEAEPAHRLIAHAMSTQPQRYARMAHSYLLADLRRLSLGGVEDRLGTSTRLVRAVASYWSQTEVEEFADAIVSYSPKPPSHLRDARSRRSFNGIVRRVKLGHLQSLPSERVSKEILKIVEEERRVFGNARLGATFSGVQAVGSPMSREAFARATDEEVIKAFQELPDATGWDHPRRRMVGGNIQLSREFAEFAKGDIDRAAHLIRKLEPTFGQRAAGYALDAIAENADPLLIVALFCELVDRGFDSEEFRNSAARAVERLVRRDYPVGNDVLGRLESWLSVEPPSDFVEDEKNAGVQSLTEEPESSEDDDAGGGSVLWDYIGFSIVPHGNYPVLEAITRILIARPDHDRLGGILSAHLQRSEQPDVWQALLYHLIQFHPTDEAVRPEIIKEIFRRYPAVLRSREAAQILAHAQWWAPSMVQEVLSEWPIDTARMRQAYAELVALLAVMQPSLSWAAEALGNMLSNSDDGDFRVGAAYSAAHLWQEAKYRHAATKLLEQLAERADQRTWEAIFGVFRLVDELTPDLDTINLLKVIADNVESVGGADATFVVERLQTLLPYEAPLVGRLTQGLVGQWRQELGDIRTAKAAVASDLVDLAITLHRLGPETRDVGTRILEDLLVIDAWEARNTLDEIDSRFRPGRSPTRKRLRRRSSRSRRR